MEPITVRIALLDRADQAAALEVDSWAFPQNDPDFDVDLMFDALDWDRFYGAWVGTGADERLAGVNSTYRFRMTVPGDGVMPLDLPCAGLTWVGVHPQFRRRGVLTAMMRRHLRDVREEGTEPIAALFASEPVIYGRFGYGLAARHCSLTVPAGAALRPVPGAAEVDVRFELADLDAHVGLISDVHERARLRRPGSVSRPSLAMNRYPLVDPPSWRVGAERLRIAVATRPGSPDPTGYALFRRRMDWTDFGSGRTDVRELMAADPATEHALWTRMLAFDLISELRAHHQPLDGLLATSLERLPSRDCTVWDNVWVRVLDVPAALEGRRYSAPFRAVLEVTDALFPENGGRWLLDGGPDGASCTRATEEADVRLDVRELGSVFLGGTTFHALAEAGLAAVDRPERLPALSSAFQSPVRPTALWGF